MSAEASGASAFVGFAIPEVAHLLAEDQAGRGFVREEGVQLQMVACLPDLFYSMSVTTAGRT